ncbi:MAG: hypothetical protein FWD17_09700 [Polyangiaceae bacterium]|nr:hypothetical protein [Polyangiaceae bacterium]
MSASRAPLARRAIDASHVRRVRLGTGANCSSIGSVVDTLFATAAIGAAVFAGVMAALKSETVHQAGAAKRSEAPNAKRSDPAGGDEGGA